MLLTLQSGKNVEIWLDHQYKENPKGGYIPFATNCFISINNEQSFEDIAICHPKDQFEKKKGRLTAFKKCLNRIREEGILNKQERTELFNRIFQFKQKNNKRRWWSHRMNDMRNEMNQDMKDLHKILYKNRNDETWSDWLSRKYYQSTHWMSTWLN